MQNVSPVLKIFLAACIGFFAIDLVVDLAFGETSFIGRIMTPLLCGLLAFLFLGRANFASLKCPACETQQPLWRKPASFRQLMWGGWTCPNCGTEMDRKGKAIERKV
jgi:ribosomal protein S27E